jgi:hypothetical protein
MNFKLAAIVLLAFLAGAATMYGLNALQTRKMFDSNKFEALHRSAVTLSSATEVGLNLTQFLGMLQALQAEASIVAEKTTSPAERRVLDSYNDLINIYKDSYIVWQVDIEAHGYSTGIADLPRDKVPLAHYFGQTVPAGLVAQIAERYKLPIETVQVQGHSIKAITVQSLWQVAREKTAAIQKLR